MVSRPGPSWRARLVRLPRAVPVHVWTITALSGILLLGWTQLVPLGQAPDESGHAALIERTADGRPYPDFDDFHPYESAMRAWLSYRPGVPTGAGTWLTAENAPPRHDRPTRDDLGGRRPFSHANQLSQHPPLYYGAMGGSLRLIRALPEGERSLDREWHLLRLLNVALIAPLPLLAWATARRLGAGDVESTVVALVPLTIPQLFHIGSSINNDNLLILLCAVLSLLLAGVVRGDRRWRTALGAGVLVGLALWTKAPAFLLLPWIAVAYSLPAFVGRNLAIARRWGPQLSRLAAAAATALLVGGWWWARNIVRHDELSPSILDDPAVAPPDTIDTSVATYLRRYVPTLVHRFWGNFGAYQAPLTPVLVATATAAAVAVIVAALWPRRTEGRIGSTGVSRRHVVGLLVLLPMLATAAFGFAYRTFRSTGIMAAIQGRYLFGALVPLATTLGIGASRLLRSRAPAVALTVAVAMQVDAVRVALRAFWAEPDASVERSLAALSAWSTWPIAVQLAWLAALVGLLITNGWLLLRWSSTRDRTPELRTG